MGWHSCTVRRQATARQLATPAHSLRKPALGTPSWHTASRAVVLITATKRGAAVGGGTAQEMRVRPASGATQALPTLVSLPPAEPGVGGQRAEVSAQGTTNQLAAAAIHRATALSGRSRVQERQARRRRLALGLTGHDAVEWREEVELAVPSHFPPRDRPTLAGHLCRPEGRRGGRFDASGTAARLVTRTGSW